MRVNRCARCKQLVHARTAQCPHCGSYGVIASTPDKKETSPEHNEKINPTIKTILIIVSILIFPPIIFVYFLMSFWKYISKPDINNWQANYNLNSLQKVLRKNVYPDIRRQAAEALGNLKDNITVDSLIDALKKETKLEVVREIIIALGKIGNQKAVPFLIFEFQNRNRIGLELEIVKALGKIGGSESMDFLTSYLKTDQSPIIQSYIALSLWRNNKIQTIDLINYEYYGEYDNHEKMRLAATLCKVAFKNNDIQLINKAFKHVEIGSIVLKNLLFHFQSPDTTNRLLFFSALKKVVKMSEFWILISNNFPTIDIIRSLPNKDRLEIVLILGSMRNSIGTLGGRDATEEMANKFYNFKHIHSWTGEILASIGHNDLEKNIRKAAKYNYDTY